MTQRAAPVSPVRRRLSATMAALALLTALFVALGLQLGLGAGFGPTASVALGAADQAVLRHSILTRDGLRPVVVADHGDRTLVPPPPSPPIALVSIAAVLALCSGALGNRAVAGTMRDRRRSCRHQPRAPPVAA